MVLVYVLDLSASMLALWAAQHLRLRLHLSTPISPEGAAVPLHVYAFVMLVFAVIFPLGGLYDSRRIVRAVDDAARVLSCTAISSLLLAGILYLSYREVSRLVFLYFVGGVTVLLLGHRGALRALYHVVQDHVGAPVRALIAGAGSLGTQVARILVSSGVTVAGFVDDDAAKRSAVVEGLPVFSDLAGLPEVVGQQGVTDVIIALPYRGQNRLPDLLVSLWRLPLRIYMIPELFDLGFARARVDYLGGITMMGLREPVIDGFQRVAKRLMDVALGTVILLAAVPLLVAIAVAIRLESRGPVLFRQQRVGENGRPFTMYKFRTMVHDAEARQREVNAHTGSGAVIHKRPDDPRITRVGRFLRRFSLDELPQLVNVLRGDMSLVGPRPELPWIVATYAPWQHQRLAVPPGMTSWYVVNGRSTIPMHLNTAEDLRYIRDYSLLQDVKILWKSVGAVIRGHGAF